MDEEQITPDYSFDASSMVLDASIAELRQEGSRLIGRTNKGVSFMQNIPQGKMLNKNEKGEWILQDLRVVA